MKRTAAAAAVALLAGMGSGCKSYEYEEEVFLEVDGSGSMRVSGSRHALSALHGLDSPTERSLFDYFDSEGIEVSSVRETERSGRAFLHVESTFEDWNDVCRHRAFRARTCGLVIDEDQNRSLELVVPAPGGGVEPAPELADDELIAWRFHFPSSVLEHNARDGIARGNILTWERTLAGHLRAPPLEIRVRFDERSVLSTTVRILTLAAATVLGAVTLGLTLLVRKGRRQLRAETD